MLTPVLAAVLLPITSRHRPDATPTICSPVAAFALPAPTHTLPATTVRTTTSVAGLFRVPNRSSGERRTPNVKNGDRYIPPGSAANLGPAGAPVVPADPATVPDLRSERSLAVLPAPGVHSS